jgi:secretion/DNA translocation related TadE-like protein
VTVTCRSERGSGTLLALIAMPIIFLAIAMIWVFVDMSMLRSKAAGAADLAALAGAAYVLDGPERACAVADDVARRNHAELVMCEVDGLDVLVDVSIASTGIAARCAEWFGVTLPPVRQGARAGL